jgi:hypothetical protein
MKLLFYALSVFLIKWGLIKKAPIKNGIAIINNGMAGVCVVWRSQPTESKGA